VTGDGSLFLGGIFNIGYDKRYMGNRKGFRRKKVRQGFSIQLGVKTVFGRPTKRYPKVIRTGS